MHGNHFLPVFGQVFLTFVVWIWMYITRLGTMYRKKIAPQSLAIGDNDFLKEVVNPSDNFENLFELPVLFYVLALTLYVTQSMDEFYFYSAWFFVLTRAVHSLIHCTSNRITLRFSAYIFGAITLWVMWFRFAVHYMAR
jgi:hypothetical protein